MFFFQALDPPDRHLQIATVSYNQRYISTYQN